jgi:hypothetical protein
MVTVPRAGSVPAAPPTPVGAVGRRELRDLRAARRGRSRAAISNALEGTPGRLRIAAIVAVLACAAFALLGASAFQARGNALAEARSDAAQLVRVQQIATSVVKADSLFTNGYLAYGLDPTDQLNAYDDAIATASRSIAEASRANPADAADLAVVNDALTQYTARVAAARANNAQGNQVATGYLRQAANLLRQGTTSPNMLPTLQKLITANTQRVDDAYATSSWAVLRLALAALLALGGLVAVQVWLARHTHRYLNTPLAAATVAVALVLAGGAVVMVNAQSRANSIRDGAYTSTLALAKARIGAYTAKSNESISLIYIGTGGPYATSEGLYASSLADVRTQLAKVTGVDSGAAKLAPWDTLHATIYARAQTDWPGAVKAGIDTGTDSVNEAFAAFDKATDAALTSQASAVDDGLGGSHGALVALGWLTLVVGLIAAGAAWAGISQRLEEYR